MPFNGAGAYAPPAADFPAVANTLIESAKYNDLVNDVAAALSLCITKDGQQVLTANIPFGGFYATAGGLRAMDGSAAVPSISFNSDTDTGLWRIGANSVGVSSNGALRGLFNASGFILPPLQVPGALILNGTITRSVAASALTVALKGFDGTDPSATNPVYVLVPGVSGGVFDGTYSVISVIAALSVIVSSGSTLGHSNGVASPVYIYLLNNAGALELAVGNRFAGGISVFSTTAEGGGGAADSGSAIYSTTARANVAMMCLQRWKSTQAAAGTWAATTGEVQLYPFPYKKTTVQIFTASGANTYTKPWDMLSAKITAIGGGGGSGGCAATTGVDFTASIGGAGGGTAIKWLDAFQVGPTETATVGTAGTAGSAGNNPGGAGGTSSFGTLAVATGGAGGSGGANAPAGNSGGSLGGAGTTGDLLIRGGASTPITFSVASSILLGSNGGGTSLGGMRDYGGTGSPGQGGLPYGGGASGGSLATGSAQTAGVSGGVGVIFVEEYYS